MNTGNKSVEEQWWDSKPEYVKMKGVDCTLVHGSVHKVLGWGRYPDEGMGWGNENDSYALLEVPEETETHEKVEKVRMHVKNILPATQKEFEQHTNQNK